MATIQGARDAHVDAKVGTLTPGKDADIIMLRTDTINVMPLNNAAGAVVTLMDTSNVDTVFIAGKLMKRGGTPGRRRSREDPSDRRGVARSGARPRRLQRKSPGLVMPARIRLAGVRDAQAIAEIYRPFVEQTAISFETEPPTREEIERRISETMTTHPWLVCEGEEQVAGYAYATRHRARAAYQWSVDTSVYVNEVYWRSGDRARTLRVPVCDPRRAAILQRVRGHRAPQSRQRGPPRISGVHAHRRLRARGLQARRVARRRVVATSIDRAQNASGAAAEPRGGPKSCGLAFSAGDWRSDRQDVDGAQIVS